MKYTENSGFYVEKEISNCVLRDNCCIAKKTVRADL